MNIYIYDPETANHLFITQMLECELKKYNNSYNVGIIKSLPSENTNMQHLTYKNVYFIFLNLYFLHSNNEQIKTDFKKLCNEKYKILYITEPIQFEVEKKLYINAINQLKPNKIVTYSKGNYNKLNIYHKLIKFYPINTAYLNLSTISLIDLKTRNTHETIFLCKLNEHRKQVINTFYQSNIKIIEDCWTKEEWANILNKHIFFLNIHRRKDCPCLETMRIYPILYNGGVIISSIVNHEEMKELEMYNIYFCKEDEMENKLLELQQNIDYEEILEKTNLFRNQKNEDMKIIYGYLENI
jgi:hypothetical protein